MEWDSRYVLYVTGAGSRNPTPLAVMGAGCKAALVEVQEPRRGASWLQVAGER